MKKLRLMIVREQKDALLKDLAKLGCVEFSELDDVLNGTEIEFLVSRESSDLMSCRSDLSTLNRAVELLAKYIPQKGRLFSAKPELDSAEFLNDYGIEDALQHAVMVTSADNKIKQAASAENRQRLLIESLKPWLNTELPLDIDSTETCSVFMGSVPSRISLEDISAALEKTEEKSELFRVSSDKSQNYIVVICIKEAHQAVQDCLRSSGFTSSAFSGIHGNAKANIDLCNAELERLKAEKEKFRKIIRAESVYRDRIKLASDKMSTRIALCEAENRLYGTESTVVMEGWFPAENELELLALLDRYKCAWDTVVPEEEEYPNVPVKLKNTKFANGLNMVTNMYNLPAYGTVDPNPVMAPFFILFYGLMMADMGYGLIMVIAALTAMKRIKPRDGALSFCQLLFYGGISTFVCGLLTGGLFGNALEVIGQILGKPEGWGVLPALFDPMKDSIYVIIGAMALGLIHLNTGMVLNAAKLIRRGKLADVFWGEFALWVTLVGIVLYLLGIGIVSGVPVVLAVGVLMVLYGGTRKAKGFGKLTSLFGTVYNVATGWFGDILSYIRIMALMLAGSVIAQVFNTIGGMANSFWLFIPVFVIGHTLNFALNLLGCYVHDMRLQCLEFFGKFYEDGGRAFAPLSVKTKYYNTAEQ